MSYTFSSGNYITSSTTPITSQTFTMSCWFNITNFAAQRTLLAIESADAQNGWRLTTQPTTGAIRLSTRANGTILSAPTTSVGAAASVWGHACAVHSGDSSRAVYLNGENKVLLTTTVTSPTGITNTVIGSPANGNASLVAVGQIAEVAIWNAPLEDSEVSSLSDGMSAYLIRPQSLVLYSPLIRDIRDLRQARSFSFVGSPPVSDHTRIYK